MDFGFWILNFGFWISDFGFRIMDFGFWILDFGFWILNFEFLKYLIWFTFSFIVPLKIDERIGQKKKIPNMVHIFPLISV